MKLAIPFIDGAIEFDGDCLNTLVVEEQRVFRQILWDISTQIEGEEGECVLSENGKILPMSKRCEIISCFVPFKMNKKSIVNHVLAAMEKEAADEKFFMKGQELLAQIEAFLYELSFESDCEIEFSKISIASVLKAVGITLREDYESLAEKVADYMQAVCGFVGEVLFVTVNMRSYFTDEEISLFADTVLGHKIKVLMLENQEYAPFPKEKRIIIDKDICII